MKKKLSFQELEDAYMEQARNEATYICEDGDNFVTIAQKHLPAGMARKDYAAELLNKNKGITLAPGVEVNL